MALPGITGETVPWVDDCPRTATPTPYSGVAGMPRNRWLASVGITGWFTSECPAGIRRSTHEAAERERRWFQKDIAAALVEEGGLAQIIDEWR
jgi:hypothetical protein